MVLLVCLQNLFPGDSSDTSEEDESEFETVSSKRKRANDSWDSSGESSSDASWGRSKKRKYENVYTFL